MRVLRVLVILLRPNQVSVWAWLLVLLQSFLAYLVPHDLDLGETVMLGPFLGLLQTRNVEKIARFD